MSAPPGRPCVRGWEIRFLPRMRPRALWWRIQRAMARSVTGLVTRAI
ncbi:hypothetical protein [Streptomyces uncialis]|nr:hypothetical protein [Streptomyces uncialis]MCX4661557.1 hypothetical protein [Streptomyces uncialis]WTE08835.1 hypothetical protein OG924_00105 [Streptomyces uncialis]